MPTLTSSEILMDVMQAFKKQFPALNKMGTDFRGPLKLDQTYYAHIPTLPTISTYDATNGYNNGLNEARSLLVDVPVTVSSHKHVPLRWKHLDSIKDQKNKYDQVIANAGYVLAKAVIDDVLATVNTTNFTQGSTFAHADCDVDMLADVCGDMNGVGAMANGRTLIVNSSAANVLAVDSRLSSKDYSGQDVGGNAYRSWRNVHGFSLIQEYPDLPTNNATALTSVTAEADDDLVTKADHGLVTGDRVIITAMTGGTGLSTDTPYFVIKISSSTFKLATSAANAQAGTGINITADGSAMTLYKANNVAAFAFDSRAFALLAGVPEDFNSGFLGGLNTPRTMGFEVLSDPDTGMQMAAVSWQNTGTGDLIWSPVICWGVSAGRQAGTNAVGAKCDYAGHIIRTA